MTSLDGSGNAGSTGFSGNPSHGDSAMASIDPRLKRKVNLGNESARWAGKRISLLDGFEADVDIEVARSRIVRLKDDLDALSASLGKSIDTGRENVPGKPSSLMIVFGAHGLNDTYAGLRVVPAETACDWAVVGIKNEEVEVGSVERCLPKAFLDVWSMPFDHMMRAIHRVEPTDQPIAVVEWADVWSSACRQPGLDCGTFFSDDEAMTGQHFTHHIVGAVDLELDVFKPGFAGRTQAPARRHAQSIRGRRRAGQSGRRISIRANQ